MELLLKLTRSKRGNTNGAKHGGFTMVGLRHDLHAL